MPSSEATPDLCVLGGSEAGLAACMGAVALGLSCVLVDDGDPNGGRNPDLALAALARAAADPACHDTAWRSVAQALARAAPDRRLARFAAMNVRVVRGTGRFADSATLMVDDHAIRARRFIIATGGQQPAWSLADGLPDGTRLSIGDLAGLERTPPGIVVLGGGPDAVSAAQSLARLGSRVTLATDALLPGLDPELTAPLLAQMRRDDVTLVSGQLRSVRADPAGMVAVLTDGTQVTAAHLLLAEETRPALQALAACADVARKHDALVLDGDLRTSQRHIFAVGRAAGARSTAEGIAQAGHVLRAALLPLPGRFDAGSVPIVTATQPQIAVVGRSTAGGADRIWRWPLAHTGGAALAEAAAGHIKIHTDRRGRIVQAGLVGSAVNDLVPFWALAIARGLTLAQLGAVVPPTLSWSESIRAIAIQDLGRRLGAPWARRALGVVRWFG